MSTFVMTLSRHIVEQERLYPEATGEFTKLLGDIALAAKVISHQVNRAGLADILGTMGTENVSGDQQQKLDVYANEAMVKSLAFGGALCAMVSEEDEDWIPTPSVYPKGRYVCCFDPLDGSSNIDSNVSIGTIFSIFTRLTPQKSSVTREDILQPGYAQKCAGYVIYGSSTMLVYTTGTGVYGFTLDPTYGSFILSHPRIQIPARGRIYSANEGNFNYWDKGIQNYLNWVKSDKAAEDGGPMRGRYIGSLVADFHRNLLKGGIFLYPGDSRSPGSKDGKLRLLYESNPLAFIAEQAQGKASDGFQRILDIQPNAFHQRTPLIIGSKKDVEIAEAFIQGKRTS